MKAATVARITAGVLIGAYLYGKGELDGEAKAREAAFKAARDLMDEAEAKLNRELVGPPQLLGRFGLGDVVDLDEARDRRDPPPAA